jgi:hypothetical protein
MQGPLVLFDLDETIIDTTYRTTVHETRLREVAHRAQSAGFSLGLNSDSPVGVLRRHAAQYGFSGPIIAERGALYSATLDGEVVDVTELGETFITLRHRMADALARTPLPQVGAVLLGDVRDWVNNLPPPPDTASPDAVLINGLRARSFGLWVRRYDHKEGKWRISAEAAKPILDLLADVGRGVFGADWDELDRDLNPAYGLCILHHRATRKHVAAGRLLQGQGCRKVYMVGDSINDHLPGLPVVHCAVGNASDAYKSLSTHVSGSARTEGVIEILENLMLG